MSRLHTAMQDSHASSGLAGCQYGSVRVGGARLKVPYGGSEVLCQELPFPMVEVANSQDYEDVEIRAEVLGWEDSRLAIVIQ